MLRANGQLAQLRGEVAQLKATVEELARRLARNSQNLPAPSADPPQAGSQRVRREASGRRPGGQPGHAGRTRALVPVTRSVVIHACAVRALSAPMAGRGSPARAASGDGDPTRATGDHGVSVASSGLPGLWRSDPGGVACGHSHGRIRPAGAGDHGTVHGGVSSLQTHHPDDTGRPFGVSIGLGTVANLEQATVQALAEPVAEARASVRAQPAAYLDETGWREGRQRAWLWTAVTAWVTVFVVRRWRSAKVAQEPWASGAGGGW